jgi:hypothetical protein
LYDAFATLLTLNVCGTFSQKVGEPVRLLSTGAGRILSCNVRGVELPQMLEVATAKVTAVSKTEITAVMALVPCPLIDQVPDDALQLNVTFGCGLTE